MPEPTRNGPDMSNDQAAAGNMAEGMQNPKGGDPVIDALKTIQVAIASLQEKGDPKAQEISQAFQGLLQAFQSGQAAQAPAGPKGEAPTPPPEAPAQPAAPTKRSKPMMENQSRGAVPAL